MRSLVNMPKKNNYSTNQNGFASIVIALTLVLVMALMTVAFAQLTRREQQNALNRQLATQAYYAAESGVNDAIADITAEPTRVIASNSDCDPNPNLKLGAKLFNKNINAAQGVSYTCVSIDLSPPSIRYTDVSPGDANTAVFSNLTTKEISELTIFWSTKTKSVLIPPTLGELLPSNTWTANKQPAVQEVSITPFESSSFDRNSLIANDYTVYGYPASVGAVANYGTADTDKGKIAGAQCDSAGSCTLKIKMPNLPSSYSYIMHITNLYDTSDIVITGKDINGDPVKFHGAQAMVDVTGKARDVLKRIQVSVPLNRTGSGPGYAIKATNVCKRISTFPNDSAIPSGPSNDQFINTSNAPTSVPTDPCFLN